MRDIYIMLKSKFEKDYDYFNSEIGTLRVKDEVTGLEDDEHDRLNNLLGKRDYAYRQVKFFEELINYYK